MAASLVFAEVKQGYPSLNDTGGGEEAFNAE